MPAGKMWTVLKEGILESGRNILGRDSRRQPNWFTEALRPLLNLQNSLFVCRLQYQCHCDRQRYTEKRALTQTVRAIKNNWFQ